MDFKPKAIAAHEQTLLTCQQNGDQKGQALALINMGVVWHQMNRPHKALEFYERALAIIKELGDQYEEAKVINSIGGAWADIGDEQKAMAFYQQSLAMIKTHGSPDGEESVLNNIARVYFNKGEVEKALTILKEIQTILQTTDNVASQITNYANIAFTYDKLANTDQAIIEMTTAIDLMKKHGLQRDTTNMSLSEYTQTLKEWQAKAERANDVVKFALDNALKIYSLMGEKGLRETLKDKGYPDKVIEDTVAWAKRITG